MLRNDPRVRLLWQSDRVRIGRALDLGWRIPVAFGGALVPLAIAFLPAGVGVFFAAYGIHRLVGGDSSLRAIAATVLGVLVFVSSHYAYRAYLRRVGELAPPRREVSRDRLNRLMRRRLGRD